MSDACAGKVRGTTLRASANDAPAPGEGVDGRGEVAADTVGAQRVDRDQQHVDAAERRTVRAAARGEPPPGRHGGRGRHGDGDAGQRQAHADRDWRSHRAKETIASGCGGRRLAAPRRGGAGRGQPRQRITQRRIRTRTGTRSGRPAAPDSGSRPSTRSAVMKSGLAAPVPSSRLVMKLDGFFALKRLKISAIASMRALPASGMLYDTCRFIRVRQAPRPQFQVSHGTDVLRGLADAVELVGALRNVVVHAVAVQVDPLVDRHRERRAEEEHRRDRELLDLEHAGNRPLVPRVGPAGRSEHPRVVEQQIGDPAGC